MTHGNMRANGIRTLDVYCRTCHRSAVFAVGNYSDDIPVPAFGPKMVCTGCGAIGADARPNWTERIGVVEFDGRRSALFRVSPH